VRKRFACALARHLDEAELREAVDREPCADRARALGSNREHRGRMVAVLHVDEVDDDDSAEIAQPELPRDHLCGLEIVLKIVSSKLRRRRSRRY